ncbi:hypothetical protein DM860_000785 [Cuscuta australis]|uniref:25S rRNA (uridine-N(3))-methyltransferase BMT5-like domain-containing protein n=1 Tax=Cuscuta australis TaxID=267555 RepID=A0A328D0N1_9ASTE|nr:hypothetical protein DM860_000785 [Cuscuta australis]
MCSNPNLAGKQFDIIVYNFPHAGLDKGYESSERAIVRWRIEEIATEEGLILTGCNDFDIKYYPRYQNKRGDGADADKSFWIGESAQNSSLESKLKHHQHVSRVHIFFLMTVKILLSWF